MTSAWTRALPGDAILEREAGTGSGWISLPVTFPLPSAIRPSLAALRARQELVLATMSTPTPRSEFLHLVVGYDGSPPAIRALDAAVRLLQGRTGGIDVVYVAHLSSVVMFSPGAIAQMESDFNQIERELRAAAEEQLGGTGAAWEFRRRQGIIADELLAAAKEIRDAHAEESVVIVVGSSSHASHRIVGSVAVDLARHSPVPLVIVP